MDCQNEPALYLEFDGGTDAGLLKLVSQTGVIKTPVWQKKKKKSDMMAWIDAVRPEQWKEKANWKQSVFFFQSVWFNLAAPVFTQRMVLLIEKMRFGRRHLNSHEALQGTECCALPPVTSPVCLGPVPPLDQTGGVTARGSHLDLEHTTLACWQIRWNDFCHNGGLPWTRAPCPMKYWWSLFLLWIIFSCTCTCFILCLFLPPFHFINVSLTSSFLSDFLWISSVSFAFQFWCGLDCACFVFEVMSSVSLSWVLFQSSVLIWWCLCFYSEFIVTKCPECSLLSRGSVGASAIVINVQI